MMTTTNDSPRLAPVLYQHTDGRQLVALPGNAAVAGDPGWVQAGPCSVDPALCSAASEDDWLVDIDMLMHQADRYAGQAQDFGDLLVERATLRRFLETAFSEAAIVAAPQPAVAWVPIHPRIGPLWTMTTPEPEPERLPRYELRAVVWAAAPECAPEPASLTAGDAGGPEAP